jgi:hypothetical protein
LGVNERLGALLDFIALTDRLKHVQRAARSIAHSICMRLKNVHQRRIHQPSPAACFDADTDRILSSFANNSFKSAV